MPACTSSAKVHLDAYEMFPLLEKNRLESAATELSIERKTLFPHASASTAPGPYSHWHLHTRQIGLLGCNSGCGDTRWVVNLLAETQDFAPWIIMIS
jgi:hypothetical protein